MEAKKEKKPAWITDKQWEAVPNVSWWEDMQVMKQSIAQQKPVTPQEALDQFSRLRNEKNWNEGA